MNYLRTNKSLFLGTRPFTSKSITENEFLDCLNRYLISHGGEKINNLNKDSISAAYDIITEEFEEKEDKFWGAVVWIQDYDMDGQINLQKT